MAPEIRLYLEKKVQRMLGKINPASLVVQSMPFGALIDNDTGKEFTPAIADIDIAYGLAAAVKLAASNLTKG